MRIALTNEFGGTVRTVDVTDDLVWEYQRGEDDKNVMVQMADGSWAYGIIVS